MADNYKRPDHHTLRAKREGFPARSIYKLEEIDSRVKLLKPGQRVVDLGAAPGSWSMYVAQKIGKAGHLLAIDLSPIASSIGSNATVIQGDALQIDNQLFKDHGPFDVVLSDMAPATSGNKAADQYRSFELCMRAIEVAKEHGKVGSHFVGKIFMGDDYETARAELRKEFDKVQTIRPDTVRKSSFEVFLVAMGKKTGALNE